MSVESSAPTSPQDVPEPAASEAIPGPRTSNHRPWARARLALPILVLVLLNLGLYTQLAPRPAQSLSASARQASLIHIALPEWIVLGGRWQRRDVTIAQESEQTQDLGIVAPVRMAPGDTYRVSVELWLEHQAQAGGILFDVQRPTSHLGSHIVRLGRDQLGAYVLCGYFDQNNTLQVQANERIAGQQLDLTEIGRVSVVVGSTSYTVLVGDEAVARDVPRMGQGGWIGLDAQGGPVIFSEARVDFGGEDAAAAPPSAATDVVATPEPSPPTTLQLPHQADFRTSLDQSAWLPFAGQWAVVNGALVQQRTDESDDGVTLENVPDREFTIRTRFHHLQGTGGGLIFDVPSRAARNGAQIVRYSEQAGGLFWGYLDQQNGFHGQGEAHTEPAGTSTHTLEVGLRRESYSIRLDGRTLAVGVPRVNRAGYVGLTTSGSSVAFETFEVLPAMDLATQLGTGPLPSARILAGEWSADATTIQQRGTTPTDLVLDTGLSAERRYRLDVTVDFGTAAEPSDVGGGVLLGMTGADTRAGAYLVRLAGGGRSALWGVFSADGGFVSLGGAQLDTRRSGPRALSVTVYATTFDVSVDGRRVAARVPFRRQGTGIGLVSVGGPVSFTSIELNEALRS